MGFLTETAVADLGLKSLGKNVRISERASIYNADQIEIGDNCRIDDFCVVSGRVTLGRNIHLAVFCNVAGGEPGITMHDFSGLAYACHVFTQSDDYSGATLTNPTVPDRYKAETKRPITIGRHAIVGAQSVVLPGAHIAEGTAIGALSMVTMPTREWSIYFGNPARRLKERKKDLLSLEAQYLHDEAVEEGIIAGPGSP